MRPLELVLILIVFAFLIAQNVRGMERKHQLALLLAGLSTIFLGVLWGQLRWQMAPAYLLYVVLSLLLFRRAHSHGAVRSIGVLIGILLLAVSVTLSLGLPVLTLPAPDGPYIVGSTSSSLLDESRGNAFFGAPDEKRELYVQVWYPGAIAEGRPEPRVRALWEELHRGELDRFTVFTRYLRGVKTHSYEGIPLSPEQASYPLIVFSHAIVSFAEQSTLLMEHLASHGYVVVAISHPYASMRVVVSNSRVVYPDLEKINEASAQFDTASDEVTARIAAAGSREERMKVQQERYEQAGELNTLAATWADDLRFVVDSITAPAAGHANLQTFSSRIDGDRIGLLGMSFGGGAVTDFCKIDTRCRAALNMDGGTFGRRQREPLQIPYLALVREGQTSLDYLLPASRSDFYSVTVEGAGHLDFTDDPVVLPILKWLNMAGPIAGERAIEITNAVSLRFFDAYLRGGPKPRFDEGFPELTVEMNAYAGE